jgi:hypothetical protein
MKVKLIPVRDTTRLPECHCPNCDRKLSAASSPKELALPKPGDISVCVYCGELLEYDSDLHSIRLSAATRAKLKRNQPDKWQMLVDYQREFREAKQAFVFTKKPTVQ